MKNTKTTGNIMDKIRLVEIELTSQCNRQCSFCPNSYIDRHSQNENMNKHVFENLIKELSTFNYSNFISFSRYNEPFMHRDVLEKSIKYIREKLPFATLVCNTNGDFDYDGIDIDQLTVMDYDNNMDEFVDEHGTFRIMKLKKINNRAGALNIKQKERNFPCYEPQFFVGVDFNGSVVPCCNIRSDIKKHKRFILGNLKYIHLKKYLN